MTGVKRHSTKPVGQYESFGTSCTQQCLVLRNDLQKIPAEMFSAAPDPNYLIVGGTSALRRLRPLSITRGTANLHLGQFGLLPIMVNAESDSAKPVREFPEKDLTALALMKFQCLLTKVCMQKVLVWLCAQSQCTEDVSFVGWLSWTADQKAFGLPFTHEPSNFRLKRSLLSPAAEGTALPALNSIASTAMRMRRSCMLDHAVAAFKAPGNTPHVGFRWTIHARGPSAHSVFSPRWPTSPILFHYRCRQGLNLCECPIDTRPRVRAFATMKLLNHQIRLAAAGIGVGI